jgi:hypothetical protein
LKTTMTSRRMWRRIDAAALKPRIGVEWLTTPRF